MPRTIIHVDLDAFFCAIEEQRDPTLRGKAFAVGGRPDGRGVVASCSYAARRFGVHSALPMARAIGLCPGLVVVPSRHGAYRAASQQVMAILGELTPKLEQISIDEAFLDVSDLVGEGEPPTTGYSLAEKVQTRIQNELGLSCSIGVASNKLIAKVATDFGKGAVRSGATPRAIHVVPPGEEAAFLAPLPPSDLWGVGPKFAAQLNSLGIVTIGQLADLGPQTLMRRFGRWGYELGVRAQGVDKREVVTHRERKSISTETTFPNDVVDWDVLAETLDEQVSEVAELLVRNGMRGGTVRIKLRWSDFTTPTRQLTLAHPTARRSVIHTSAVRLLRELWTPEQGVRLLGVGVTGLTPVLQLSLWGEGEFDAGPTPMGRVP